MARPVSSPPKRCVARRRTTTSCWSATRTHHRIRGWRSPTCWKAISTNSALTCASLPITLTSFASASVVAGRLRSTAKNARFCSTTGISRITTGCWSPPGRTRCGRRFPVSTCRKSRPAGRWMMPALLPSWRSPVPVYCNWGRGSSAASSWKPWSSAGCN